MQLKIIWDGTAPGLQEHQLSVSAFGKSFVSMLRAIQRVSTNVITGSGDSESGAKGGRYAERAQGIDLRVVSVGHGCLDMDLVVSFPELEAAQIPLVPDDVPEKTMQAFLEAITAESSGKPGSAAVRSFLKSLPEGVSMQEYRAFARGREIASTRVSEVEFVEDEERSTYLVRIAGRVTGVIFPPDAPEVRISRSHGMVKSTVRMAATEEQIEQALLLRHQPVVARAFSSESGLSLLSLDPLNDFPAELLSYDDVRTHVLSRWEGTLQRLAQ